MKRFNRKKGKMSYKYTVSLSLFGLIVIFVAIICCYTYYHYQVERHENAKREAQYTASRLVAQIDERFGNLYQYYISSMLEDDMKWMLENNVKYSDYSHYSDAADIMASKKIFWDYIDGFALINFRSKMVLSNKGMFSLDEIYNKDELREIYEKGANSINRSYWYYKEGAEVFKLRTQEIDKNDRYTIEVDGLNLIMNLPLDSVSQNSLVVINLNMDSWKRWLGQWLDDAEDVMVCDNDGKLLYSTNTILTEQFYEKNIKECITVGVPVAFEGVKYMPGEGASGILGWRYYTFYNMEEGQKTAIHLSDAILVLMVAFLLICVYIISYIIYRPVKQLMNGLSGEQEIRGNELDYLADSFANLRNDKQSLENVVEQQQDKLQELFELRLIRGEVRFNDELDEYMQNLHLNRYRFFATAVMVLNLSGEQEAQSNINEDAICLNLVEAMPKRLKQYIWMPLVYNACTLFCIFGNDDENQLLEQITGFHKEFQQYSESISGYRVLMGVSATHTDYHHMRAAYRESVSALTMPNMNKISELNSQLGGEISDIADCHFYLSTTTMSAGVYNNSFEKEIQIAIKALDKEQCYKVVDEFSGYLQQCKKHDETMVFILRFVNTILFTAMEAKVDLNELYPDGLKKIYQEIMEVVEPTRVRRYLKRVLIDEIIQARGQLLEKSSYSMMEEIERKIVESKGNITLAECADALGVHTTYIWKILKMEKGKSFSDFLEEYKLNEAKRLLMQTNLSVAEIATELNYTNAQNFIRFFSKGTGVTPGKFRKLY